MTAPMTRERLVELRILGAAVSRLELLDACEALLTERESVRDAALEEAAQGSIGFFDRDGNAAPERIRALKGKR